MSSASSSLENASSPRLHHDQRPRPVISTTQNARTSPSGSSSREVTPRPIAQTGRSRTAPSLDAVAASSRLEASGRPQLNERDSIFATNYVPASSPDSPPTFPAVLDSATRSYIDRSKSREGKSLTSMSVSGVTTQSTKPPHNEQVSSLSLSSSADQQGYIRRTLPHDRSKRLSVPLQDILLGRVGDHNPATKSQPSFWARGDCEPFVTSNASPNTTALYTGDNDIQSKSTGDLDAQTERMRYRSWREGKPVYPGRKLAYTPPESVFEDPSYLEKSIAAKLPKAEPTVHPRSRKASHYLGLFMHHEPPGESHSKEGLEQGKAQNQDGKHVGRKGHELVQASPLSSTLHIAVEPATDAVEPRDHEPYELYNRDNARKDATGQEHVSCLTEENSSRQGLVSKQISTSESHPPGSNLNNRSSRQVPRALVEEIGNKHNITPVSRKGNSISPSIGTMASERTKPEPGPMTSNDNSLDAHDYFRNGSYAKNDGVVRVQRHAEEDEESEKEHISSAVYFPHLTPGLADSASFEENGREDGSDLRKVITDLPTERGPGRMRERRSSRLGEVEISLQSQNERHHLHGELQRSRPRAETLARRLISPSDGALSVSESEQDSVDEFAPSNGYQSSNVDEQEITPTVSPEQRRVHTVLDRDNVPLGAVELKPFSHQVGGHSTVYRFSRRAVCKQLNNRENVFYETIERQHPELLDFMPRYDLSPEVLFDPLIKMRSK